MPKGVERLVFLQQGRLLLIPPPKRFKIVSIVGLFSPEKLASFEQEPRLKAIK